MSSQKLWVLHRTAKSDFGPTKVSVDGCADVDDFKLVIRGHPHLAIPPNQPIALYHLKDGQEIGIDVGDSPADYLVGNSRRNPLVVRCLPAPAVPVAPTLWRATGSITGARKVGFRRGMYRTAQTHLGFYEKRDGVRLDPFSYQDDGTLAINVLFKQESQALSFFAVVYEDVDVASPQGFLTVSLSVDPAADAVLDEMILVRHYVRDKDSPPDTPRHSSIVTGLPAPSPLLKYQSIEAGSWLGGHFKGEKAHLIDKAQCNEGTPFAKYKDNENNFLALSSDVHRWFDAISCHDGISYFKLSVKHVSQEPDPDNDFRYRVALTVEGYNVTTANAVFARLKEGSTILSDTHAETFVYVKNPVEFCECLSWKSAKIDKIWNDTPAVE
jgi:hypothetical protein